MKMAASAPLSNNFSLCNPERLHPLSKTPNNLALVHRPNKHLLIPGKPIPSIVFSSYSPSNSFRRNGNSRIVSHTNGRRSFYRPFVSVQPDSQPLQTKNGAGSEKQKQFPSLKALLQAYKDAILDGDEKTMHEIEDFIAIMEKEKNELNQKFSDMSEEISSGKEKYLRLQADFDNYRKRMEKERLTTRSNAQGEVIESLLPMVDSFERAKQQIKLETEKEKKIDTSYQGIYKQFVEIMRSLRVAAVPTVGKPFDPTIHEAIAREESVEYKEGVVIQELRRGFYLGDRLLRPAMVKVSSGPGKKKPPPAPHQSSDQAASVVGVDNR